MTDRFHVLINLQEVLKRLFERKYEQLRASWSRKMRQTHLTPAVYNRTSCLVLSPSSPLTFSAVTLEFSTVTMGVSKEKVLPVALYFGLFLQLQWKVRFFYSYDGNPNHLG